MAASLEPTRSSVERGGRAPYVLFPIQYPHLWNAYKLAQSSFWTADEVYIGDDAVQWREVLTDDDRRFLSIILAFFAASDGIVVDNLAQRFCAEVDIPEARCFYAFQMMMENVHAEVYSRFVQELIEDVQCQHRLFSAVERLPVVKAKADWCLRWISDVSVDLPTRLVAFAIVEGIFFSSSFAALFWLRERNVMPGLTFSNELIARDEGQHTAFACLLYAHLHVRIATAVVYEMVGEAVKLEQAFFSEALPNPLPGMTAALMCDYVEYIADFLLRRLGYAEMYRKENPFQFMQRTAMDAKTNFFERSLWNLFGGRRKASQSESRGSVAVGKVDRWDGDSADGRRIKETDGAVPFLQTPVPFTGGTLLLPTVSCRHVSMDPVRALPPTDEIGTSRDALTAGPDAPGQRAVLGSDTRENIVDRQPGESSAPRTNGFGPSHIYPVTHRSRGSRDSGDGAGVVVIGVRGVSVSTVQAELIRVEQRLSVLVFGEAQTFRVLIHLAASSDGHVMPFVNVLPLSGTDPGPVGVEDPGSSFAAELQGRLQRDLRDAFDTDILPRASPQ